MSIAELQSYPDPGMDDVVRHPLTVSDDDRILDGEGNIFDIEQYCRMKFGSLNAARDMGLELGRYLVEQAPEFVVEEPTLISPFMYKHVPSAAYTIGKYAFAVINDARVENGVERIHVRQISITNQPNNDYSKLSVAERERYMLESGLRLIDTPVAEQNVLLLDDIRITGTYSKLVRAMIGDEDGTRMLSSYWAAITPEQAKKNPAVENQINSGKNCGLELIADIIENDRLLPTLRTLKVVLAEKDPVRLNDFLHSIPQGTLLELYEGTVGTGGDLQAMYPDNYKLLVNVARSSTLMPKSSAFKPTLSVVERIDEDLMAGA